jgi:hypothetical protein
MKHFDESYFREICEQSKTMAEASRRLEMHFNTFKRHALRLGCYNANQSGKGTHKVKRSEIKTSDILDGKYPDYQTFKLKIRMIDEGYIEDRCEMCGWNSKRVGETYTPCELHHKDGNPHNHRRDNLILLCPNCHSLTDTHRSKNRAHSKETSDVNAG